MVRTWFERQAREARKASARSGPRPDKISSIRAGLRTGDTPANERSAMLRRPPHILVTTPERTKVTSANRSGTIRATARGND